MTIVLNWTFLKFATKITLKVTSTHYLTLYIDTTELYYYTIQHITTYSASPTLYIDTTELYYYTIQHITI